MHAITITVIVRDDDRVAMKAGVASQWRQQDCQFESLNGRRMSGQAFELVEGVKSFNLSHQLPLTVKHFRRNKSATTMVGVVAAILIRLVERKGCYSATNSRASNHRPAWVKAGPMLL